jgi:hypothetical protein
MVAPLFSASWGRLTFHCFSDTLSSPMRLCAFTFLAFLCVFQPSSAQLPGQRKAPRTDLSNTLDPQLRRPQQAEARKLFGLIERGISDASLGSASSSFAQQVFVNMSEGESGYFSANQTVSILQRYLSNRSSLSFTFSRYGDSGSTPYATGRLTSISKGRRESAQIYVSLRLHGSKWVITQFNIY